MKIGVKSTFRPKMDSGQYIAARITPGVIAAIEQADQVVLQEALLIVAVDTGELKASGHVLEPKQTGKTVTGGVAFDANHAAYVEFGTGIRGAASAGAAVETAGFHITYSSTWPGMRAQPYLRPALDTARQQIREAFRSQVALRMVA